MPPLTNEEVVDRLPIRVSGERIRKLLAAQVTDGKAESTALRDYEGNQLMEPLRQDCCALLRHDRH